MKVLVTGAHSPVGRRVLVGLRDDHDVTVLTRPGLFDPMRGVELGVRVIEGDLVTPDRWGPQVAGVEVVIHLDERSQAPDPQLLDVNLKGTQSLLHGVSAWGQPRLFVHLSTALLTDPSPDDPDVGPARFGSAWLAGRCAAEARVCFWARKTGIETVVVRAGHPFGALGVEGPLTGWLEAAADSAETGRPLELAGAAVPLPFVHVDELARAIVARVQGEPMPGEQTLVKKLSRVQAVGLVVSLGQVHDALCHATEQDARRVEPRTSFGERLIARLRRSEPAPEPSFMRVAPMRTPDPDWVARFGERDLGQVVDALVGGAC